MKSYIPGHKVILGDARNMSSLPDRSVHLVVTSPPYWQIKDYGPVAQIGYHQTYEEYVNNLNLVWAETFRVLKDGCRLCINIGDQYARAIDYGRYKVIPIRTEIIKFCEYSGFDYMGAIIWQKVSTTRPSGGATVMGSFPFPRNGIIKLDYEFILIFKKPGRVSAVSKQIKEQSQLSTDEWNTYFTGHWNFPGEKQQDHQAMFPEELPHRLIKMFSFIGEKVLDPFLGSGTTMISAEKLKRDSVGFEINPAFLPVIKQRTEKFCQRISFENEENHPADYAIQIKKLGYAFQDPHKLQKQKTTAKADAGHGPTTRHFLRVKKIISPTDFYLNDGREIKLLGIRINKDMETQAIAYLKSAFAKSRVFLKFDAQAEKSYCYLYLENKTFINAHLIKRGFASPDQSDHKYRDRFFTYKKQNQ